MCVTLSGEELLEKEGEVLVKPRTPVVVYLCFGGWLTRQGSRKKLGEPKAEMLQKTKRRHPDVMIAVVPFSS